MKDVLFYSRSLEAREGEFTSNLLGSREKAAVKSFVSWVDAPRHTRLIEEAHGRSIFIKSPERRAGSERDFMHGRYDGLQLIGLGGSLHALQSGIFETPQVMEIYPVDDENYAEELAPILEIKRIDENGELIRWQRPYAPLHGMDAHEAKKRAEVTSRLWKVVTGLDEREVPLFTVPQLAAEGFLPTKRDPTGEPLRFQVYRVPLIDRFPAQFTRRAINQGLDRGLALFMDFSFQVGRVLKTLHEDEKLAYMDGHIGNMSFLKSGHDRSVYVTDLGSMEDITGHPFPERNYAIDFWTFLESSSILLSSYLAWLKETLDVDDLDPEQVAKDLQRFTTSSLLAGYFLRELSAESNTYRVLDLQKAATSHADTLLESYSETTGGQFVKDFEGFYREIRMSRQ